MTNIYRVLKAVENATTREEVTALMKSIGYDGEITETRVNSNDIVISYNSGWLKNFGFEVWAWDKGNGIISVFTIGRYGRGCHC